MKTCRIIGGPSGFSSVALSDSVQLATAAKAATDSRILSLDIGGCAPSEKSGLCTNRWQTLSSAVGEVSSPHHQLPQARPHPGHGPRDCSPAPIENGRITAALSVGSHCALTPRDT